MAALSCASESGIWKEAALWKSAFWKGNGAGRNQNTSISKCAPHKKKNRKTQQRTPLLVSSRKQKNAESRLLTLVSVVSPCSARRDSSQFLIRRNALLAPSSRQCRRLERKFHSYNSSVRQNRHLLLLSLVPALQIFPPASDTCPNSPFTP